MASEWPPTIKEIKGIDLANYFPQKRSVNSIVFIHKKFLEPPKRTELKKEKEKPKKVYKNKSDKCQQFSADKITEFSKDRTYKISNTTHGINNNDSVLEQTIKFAKNIVPLVIPPSDDRLPVFYTIKTARKHRKKEKKPPEPAFDPPNHGYEKRESKKIIETYRKVKKESSSVRDSISHTSNNTLDDLNINQSLCCTFSETSEKKYHKKEKTVVKKERDGQKIVVSESFEALATENIGESKLKIHLMNDKDKHFLSESIKIPILNAIKDCIAELNNNNLSKEVTTVQKIVKCNTQKLDTIMDKLTCIEKKLDAQAQEKVINAHAVEKKVSSKSVSAKLEDEDKKVVEAVHNPTPKPSKLEELGEDLLEVREDYSSEEELHQEWLDRRSKSAVSEIVSDDRSERNMETLGGGEVTRALRPSSIGQRLERPNRIPTRFCWTDAARK